MHLRTPLLAIIAVASAACQSTHVAPPPPVDATSIPKNIIFFISDGCGPASFTMARDFRRTTGGPGLAIDDIKVGSVQTFSATNLITDSAAAGTALACGVKTYNGGIGLDTLHRPVASLLEAAEQQGMATGLVVTSTITHATPASFSAHVFSRGSQDSIAVQQLEQGIEVLLGGGASYFLPSEAGGLRPDGRDLMAEAETVGYQVVRTPDGLRKVDRTPVLGLFAMGHMSYEIDRDASRQPALAEMTRRAIELLDDDPDGFFLMVEGSRIDHAAHGNDAAAHLRDVLAFDEAVAAALVFARKNAETLVISTSDHETGGMALGRRVDGLSGYVWKPDELAGVEHSLAFASDSLLENTPWKDVLALFGVDRPTERELHAGDSLAVARRALADIISRRARVGWTTGGHTAVDVGMFAFGPGSQLFRGHQDNTDVGRKVATLMRVDLHELTQRLGQESGGSIATPSGR